MCCSTQPTYYLVGISSGLPVHRSSESLFLLACPVEQLNNKITRSSKHVQYLPAVQGGKKSEISVSSIMPTGEVPFLEEVTVPVHQYRPLSAWPILHLGA